MNPPGSVCSLAGGKINLFRFKSIFRAGFFFSAFGCHFRLDFSVMNNTSPTKDPWKGSPPPPKLSNTPVHLWKCRPHAVGRLVFPVPSLQALSFHWEGYIFPPWALCVWYWLFDDAGSTFSLKKRTTTTTIPNSVPWEEGLPAFPSEICYSNAAAVRAAREVVWQGNTGHRGESEAAMGLWH